MNLHQARQHLGAWVVYDPGHGQPEDGHIERVTLDYVMVRYRDGVKATPAERLSFGGGSPQ